MKNYKTLLKIKVKCVNNINNMSKQRIIKKMELILVILSNKKELIRIKVKIKYKNNHHFQI